MNLLPPDDEIIIDLDNTHYEPMDIRDYIKMLYGAFEELYRNTRAGCAINRGAKSSMDLIEDVLMQEKD